MQLAVQLFGRRIELTAKALPPLHGLTPSARGGWWPIIRESSPGAWQQNVTVEAGTALSYSAVYACVSLIAADISKLGLRLVEETGEGIWRPTENPAFSPVLRKPNRYQTIIKFLEQWIVSKLTRGNTYILKQRDRRGVVTALYVLDPGRVTPLVTMDGAVYYEIKRDDLSGLPQESVTVPASEIIHDIMCALFHPLIGVTPIYASGTAALQGLAIQTNSQKFFSAGSSPSGILTAPGSIDETTAQRLKAYFETNFSGDNVGKVAVAGDGLKYERLSMSAVDAQLIDQLKWTAETVCSCFHVPAYMIGIGPPPPYANVEPLLQAYYAQCLQNLITCIETLLDEGLGIATPINGVQYGTELDIDDLIWMDTATRTKAAGDSIGSGALSPNEARAKYHGVGPVIGGNSPMVQQQYYSLAALAARDAADPFATPAAPPPAPVPAEDGAAFAASFDRALRRKTRARWPHAA